MPPYILPDQTGLYGAYLNLLSERLPENDFTLTFLPRGRINWLLENEDLDGIVIGVNPLWFNDSEQKKHI
jgi:polar amino acid transport system substrate-binding protein